MSVSQRLLTVALFDQLLKAFDVFIFELAMVGQV
jgi:hypothetical protein